MDDRTRPDTNVVLLRRKGDPCEAERERVASTIFAEPDDVATFSRGNLVPPRPDARDGNEEPAPSADPFFDRLQASSEVEEAARTDLADGGESTDAYFDRLATQSPAEMSTNGATTPAVTPMPGSALLPAEFARPGQHPGRARGRLIAPAVAIRPWAALRRSRLAWLSAATLGALAALVAGIAVIGASGSPSSERQQSQREASASSLEPLRPGVLAASANPFGATTLLHRSVSRLRHEDPSNSGLPKSHHADTRTSAQVKTSVKPRAVAAKYTPPERTSTTVAVNPNTQSGSATGTTPPATPPPAPTHSTSSSNSGSGSNSGSASPSRATLRSLVTGAGQCSC